MMTTAATSYRVLAAAFAYPRERLYQALKGVPEFERALRETSIADLQREYLRLFTPTVAGGLPLYETEYGRSEIFLKTQQLADIAGFYRAFGLDLTESSHERVDFIGAELEFMDWLLTKEERAGEKGKDEKVDICRNAAQKFMTDHLGRWAGYFGDRIAQATRHPFYRLLGSWLTQFVESECRRLQAVPKRVTRWTPDPEVLTELECGPDAESRVPQPLTVHK